MKQIILQFMEYLTGSVWRKRILFFLLGALVGMRTITLLDAAPEHVRFQAIPG
jgi:hypothetical protein